MLGIFTVVALLLVGALAGRRMAGPVLAALACLAAGAGIGFLFGIPKILQADRLPESSDPEKQRALSYRQQVNTNLTEISDWLTKIIVGLGLINLKEIPGYLDGTARNLARGMDAANVAKHLPFATSVLITFSVLGFLFGYLATRLVLQSAFSRADRAAAGLMGELAEIGTKLDEVEVRVNAVETEQRAPESASPAAQEPTREPATKHARDEDRGARSPGGSAARQATAGEKAGDTDAKAQLLAMAWDYAEFHHPDRHARVSWKDQLAARMASFARHNDISKAELGTMAENVGLAAATHGAAAEGVAGALILTLAQLCLERPEAGDTQLLLRVAGLTHRWHAQYRVVLAFSRLLRDGLVPDEARPEIERVLTDYEKDAG
ncbi:MAG TPA: hypothetical protein VM759_02940, partial [Longimicrobium sp.]|nr:hypothetical protein [Longimicrobium sp.]